MNTVYYLHAQAHGNRFNLILFDPPPQKKRGKKTEKETQPTIVNAHTIINALPTYLSPLRAPDRISRSSSRQPNLTD